MPEKKKTADLNAGNMVSNMSTIGSVGNAIDEGNTAVNSAGKLVSDDGTLTAEEKKELRKDTIKNVASGIATGVGGVADVATETGILTGVVRTIGQAAGTILAEAGEATGISELVVDVASQANKTIDGATGINLGKGTDDITKQTGKVTGTVAGVTNMDFNRVGTSLAGDENKDPLESSPTVTTSFSSKSPEANSKFDKGAVLPKAQSENVEPDPASAKNKIRGG